jgi:Bacteriophage lambda head decoration protein D
MTRRGLLKLLGLAPLASVAPAPAVVIAADVQRAGVVISPAPAGNYLQEALNAGAIARAEVMRRWGYDIPHALAVIRDYGATAKALGVSPAQLACDVMEAEYRFYVTPAQLASDTGLSDAGLWRLRVPTGDCHMPLYFNDVFVADPHDSGSFIITEANGNRSRDTVTLRGGAGMVGFGTVLGKSNADGKWIPCPATGSVTDGSDQARAILWEDTDARTADVAAGVVARDCDVFGGALTYDPSVTPSDQLAKAAQLAAVGINVRAHDNPEARAENLLRQDLGW